MINGDHYGNNLDRNQPHSSPNKNTLVIHSVQRVRRFSGDNFVVLIKIEFTATLTETC